MYLQCIRSIYSCCCVCLLESVLEVCYSVVILTVLLEELSSTQHLGKKKFIVWFPLTSATSLSVNWRLLFFFHKQYRTSLFVHRQYHATVVGMPASRFIYNWQLKIISITG